VVQFQTFAPWVEIIFTFCPEGRVITTKSERGVLGLSLETPPTG
jgi:hypothetical protein